MLFELHVQLAPHVKFHFIILTTFLLMQHDCIIQQEHIVCERRRRLMIVWYILIKNNKQEDNVIQIMKKYLCGFQFFFCWDDSRKVQSFSENYSRAFSLFECCSVHSLQLLTHSQKPKHLTEIRKIFSIFWCSVRLLSIKSCNFKCILPITKRRLWTQSRFVIKHEFSKFFIECVSFAYVWVIEKSEVIAIFTL